MILNEKKVEPSNEPISIKVGATTITQEKNAKLLGVTMDDLEN